MSDVTATVEQFLSHRQLKGLTPDSLNLYRYWLGLWLTWRASQGYGAALADVSADELRAFFRYLAEDHIPHSTNKHRPAAKKVGLSLNSRDGCWRTLRALWNWLADEERLQPRQIGLFRRDRVPRPQRHMDDDGVDERQVVDDALVQALLSACGPPMTELVARNRALILMLYESGMRVSELCSLDDRQVQLAERQARIKGKGGRRRFVFWGPQTAAALQRYLALRSGASGPLFQGLSSTNSGLRLTRNAVRGVLRRLAAAARVQLPPGAPIHGFRAGFAQNMLDAGVDGLDLQQLLGHTDIRTTTIYVRRSPGRLREVHRRAARGCAGKQA